MALPPIVESILKSSAPTLLAGLLVPPPFNLLASAVVSSAIRAFLPSDQAAAIPPDAPLPPPAVIATVQANAGNPDFLTNLRAAEIKLQQFEMANDVKFAELANKDRASARSFQVASAIAGPMMRWGMAIVFLAIGSMLLVVIGAILMIAGVISPNPTNSALAAAWYTIIGTILGNIAGYASQIISFYYGDNARSQGKDDSISQVLSHQGQQLGDAAAVQASIVKQIATPPPPIAVLPTVITDTVAWKQGPFGGLRWQVTPAGILDEGDITAARTVGEPVTVRRIWKDFGTQIKAASLSSGVPLELIVTTIAVESRGIAKALLSEPDGRQSIGLMQTLTGTASDMLGRPVTAQELNQPEISIAAGTAYLASQRPKTLYDPLLAAAAYNAGGLYPPRAEDTNPYRMRCTGDHLTRTKLYYNDTVAVAAADGWFN